jgi:hypothetical protein
MSSTITHCNISGVFEIVTPISAPESININLLVTLVPSISREKWPPEIERPDSMTMNLEYYNVYKQKFLAKAIIFVNGTLLLERKESDKPVTTVKATTALV